MNSRLTSLLALTLLAFTQPSFCQEILPLTLTYQTETAKDSGRYHTLQRQESWPAASTALIICDMWDSHHCVNAVRRVNEIAPRINKLANALRAQGATIIHAPSECLEAYANNPARTRAAEIQISADTPTDIVSWCDRIPAEESAAYPIDQSAGGEDDDLQEHEQWKNTLIAMGRKPGTPWLKQIETISIDEQKDYITDKGPEVWNILTSRKIDRVMLVGVHINMCVLGRPFGLRQLAQHGKNVVLVRDLTDTMYDPRAWPYVNHFSGTDLIIDHTQRHVCPTITSDQVLHDKTFRFRGDNRKHVAIIMAESEYDTNRTLTELARTHLAKDFRISLIYGPEPIEQSKPEDGIAGLEALDTADVLFVSARRKPLPPDQLKRIQDFVASGKPVVGIRTASHAFSLRDGSAPTGTASWTDLDRTVFGGSYTNHFANDLHPTLSLAKADQLNAFLPDSIKSIDGYKSEGSLYQTAPLAPGANALLLGSVEGKESQPIAWTFVRPDGGRSFYTSLGHSSDFKSPVVRQLLVNAVRWSVDLPPLSADSLLEHEKAVQSGHGRQRK